ncbi:MAG: NAD(P)/FAD-dependent oxidoreductase, partial [Yoonia sp.]|nr:NAD(P)/FAD-dependent oxidoreductase [Yoonia sp.]
MQVKTLIIGAGAAGMMCAAHAGADTLVVDHAKAAGEKIRISGGGRCNFTNMHTTAANFISQNPHFAKSALKRYTQWDFISLVAAYGISYHEKALGQLFCDDTARDIVAMLRSEMKHAQLWLQTKVGEITHDGTHFHVTLSRDDQTRVVTATNLVMASGGKSIPKMGATGLVYQTATQFGLGIVETRPGLVPLTFTDERFKTLAGTALPARVSANGTSFDEAMLFTHRGLSGPAILQASSYWRDGDAITTNLIPQTDLFTLLKSARQTDGRKALTTIIGQHLPSKLVNYLTDHIDMSGTLADQSDAKLQKLCENLQNWTQTPTGSEGYRTAEVTLGGVDTNDLSSKTMAAKTMPNLYFIGEAVDVTGWLGGYNFQWAWASGHAAG